VEAGDDHWWIITDLGFSIAKGQAWGSGQGIFGRCLDACGGLRSHLVAFITVNLGLGARKLIRNTRCQVFARAFDNFAHYCISATTRVTNWLCKELHTYSRLLTSTACILHKTTDNKR
jgi:hypothetical protein